MYSDYFAERSTDMSWKMYLMNYPSSLGMGSNFFSALINENDVRRIIREEVTRMREEKPFCDRYTGTWNEETFCDSDDMAEIEEDVLKKRTTSCSSYAGVNDLIPIPENADIRVKEIKMYDTIFHVWNEFMYCHDIIAGEAVFTRYIVDAPELSNVGLLDDGRYHEFVRYDMKRVLENTYFMNDKKTMFENLKRRYERIKSKLDGTFVPDGETYIDDLAECDMQEPFGLYKKEWVFLQEKFASPVTCDDTYTEHLYTHMPHAYFRRAFKKDLKEMETTDFRDIVYDYADTMHCIGLFRSGDSSEPGFFRYDELFKKGDDLSFLPAVFTASRDTPRGSRYVNVCAVFDEVFGIS